jgi:hypothetical protein
VVEPLVAHEAGPSGGGEDQLEVLGLAGVGYIDQPVGLRTRRFRREKRVRNGCGGRRPA